MLGVFLKTTTRPRAALASALRSSSFGPAMRNSRRGGEACGPRALGGADSPTFLGVIPRGSDS
jgi:hypothetical protein